MLLYLSGMQTTMSKYTPKTAEEKRAYRHGRRHMRVLIVRRLNQEIRYCLNEETRHTPPGSAKVALETIRNWVAELEKS